MSRRSQAVLVGATDAITLAERVEALALGPDDVVVITLPGEIDADHMEAIVASIRSALGEERRALVLSGGASVTKLSREDAARLLGGTDA